MSAIASLPSLASSRQTPGIIILSQAGAGLSQFEDQYLYERLTNANLGLQQRFDASREIRERANLDSDTAQKLFDNMRTLSQLQPVNRFAYQTGMLSALASQNRVDSIPVLKEFVIGSLETDWNLAEEGSGLRRYIVALTAAQRSSDEEIIDAVAQFAITSGFVVGRTTATGPIIKDSARDIFKIKQNALWVLMGANKPGGGKALAEVVNMSAPILGPVGVDASIPAAVQESSKAELEKFVAALRASAISGMQEAAVRMLSIYRPDSAPLEEALFGFQQKLNRTIATEKEAKWYNQMDQAVRLAISKTPTRLLLGSFLREMDADLLKTLAA